MHINFLLFTGLTQLDLTGPYEVLIRAPGATVDFVGESMNPVVSDRGLALLPTVTLTTARRCDLLVVPGGPGTDNAILDTRWVEFTRHQALTAKYVFGICTGSLLLGAAGLIHGKRSAGHWQARDLLTQFGAIVSNERMCIDGNIFSAGGVTSGIDMAIKVVALIYGDETAKQIQLQIEYDPQPPFSGGTPYTSDEGTVASCLAASNARRLIREKAVQTAALNLQAYKG